VSVMVDGPVVARVCAIDIGKAALVACVRVPHDTLPGRRAQQVRELSTHTRALHGLADWLRCQQVELVAMEATSDYWKPVYYLLEAQGSPAGYSTPSTSRTSPGVRRPTSWTRSGWPRSSRPGCADPAWSTPHRSAACGT